MKNCKKISSEGFSDIYKDLAEIVGIENTLAIFKCMRGQQVTFPKRLYSVEYVIEQVKDSSNKNVKKLAMEFDYTEKYLRQILKEVENK